MRRSRVEYECKKFASTRSSLSCINGAAEALCTTRSVSREGASCFLRCADDTTLNTFPVLHFLIHGQPITGLGLVMNYRSVVGTECVDMNCACRGQIRPDLYLEVPGTDPGSQLTN